MPGGDAGLGLKKDWITLLVSTSGVLLALIGAVIGVYHSAVDHFNGLILVVDAVAIATMWCFMRAAQLGLDALGSLILASEQMSPGGDGAERVRARAGAADRWFRRGVTMAVVTAVVAVAALNIIAATH
ncbi:MAG: hypothetical protein QOJ12_2429 [Thermoleophilales bacterium]|jgi:hypothetical protein|nr:hypothetical protein [Thermoleophilales bacterium]